MTQWTCDHCNAINPSGALCCHNCTRTTVAPAADEELPLDQEAREIVIKWALWDAGFSGEQSAERGPVMLKVFELIEAARKEGQRVTTERLAAQLGFSDELSAKDAQIAELERQLEAATGVNWQSDFVTVSRERDTLRAENARLREAMEWYLDRHSKGSLCDELALKKFREALAPGEEKNDTR